MTAIAEVLADGTAAEFCSTSADAGTAVSEATVAGAVWQGPWHSLPISQEEQFYQIEYQTYVKPL